LSEAQLAAARQHGDNDALAEALLDRAVIHSLQEEIRAAFDLFSQVEDTSQTDPNRSLRALSYAILTLYQQYNCMPDGTGGSATEITVRWRGAPDLQPLDARRQTRRGAANVGARAASF